MNITKLMFSVEELLRVTRTVTFLSDSTTSDSGTTRLITTPACWQNCNQLKYTYGHVYAHTVVGTNYNRLLKADNIQNSMCTKDRNVTLLL